MLRLFFRISVDRNYTNKKGFVTKYVLVLLKLFKLCVFIYLIVPSPEVTIRKIKPGILLWYHLHIKESRGRRCYEKAV